MKGLEDMISGNFCRENDKLYLKKFRKELKKGTILRELNEKYGIPYPTLKVILRNLVSGNYLEVKKVWRAYIYGFPSGCLTKPEAAPEKSSPFYKLTGDCRCVGEDPVDDWVDRTGV